MLRPRPMAIGWLPVHVFGVLMATGFLAAGAVLQHDLGRKGWPPDVAWAIVGAGAVGGLVGARSMLAVHHWQAFTAAPLAFFTSASGFVWYGGLLGGVLATLWPIAH